MTEPKSVSEMELVFAEVKPVIDDKKSLQMEKAMELNLMPANNSAPLKKKTKVLMDVFGSRVGSWECCSSRKDS